MKSEKMSETSFFADPKVIISLVALVLSIASLIWTLANQWEQNRRWEKLNNANPQIKEIKMTTWKEISMQDVQNTNWGYDPNIYSKPNDYNMYLIPYRLIGRDSNDNVIDRINPVYTIDDFQEELIRIGFKGDKVNLSKLFRVGIIVENYGKIDANKFKLQMSVLIGGNWVSAFTSNTAITLVPNQSSSIYFDFELPVDNLPQEINFKASFTFNDLNNNIIERHIPITWSSHDNLWSYAPDK